MFDNIYNTEIHLATDFKTLEYQYLIRECEQDQLS